MTEKKKKDLTRIEDMGEFFHEEEASGFPDFTSEDSSSPESNSEESPVDFGALDFGTAEEFPAGSAVEEPTFGADTEEELPTEVSEENLFSDPPLDEPLSDLVEETFSEAENNEKTRSLNFELPPLEEKEETPAYVPEPVYKKPETFEEIKKFADSTSFTGMGVEGNPSFSVLLRQVKYVEDVSDIIILLKELKLLTDTEEETQKRLSKGYLLIPRISEYAAILLTHKLRRFDIDIQMGLSDEIHPPKHHEAPETGLVSKSTLQQNQTHSFNFDHPKLELSQVIVSASPTLQGYQVVRYLGVASEHKTVPAEMVEDESSEEIPRYYQELAQKLRAHAVKNHSNAVVGLNYQLTPIPSEFGAGGPKYRLSCTGNLVWVNKL